MNDQPLQTKPERATRRTAPVRGEHAAAGRPATSENVEARASRPKRRQARRKRPKRRFSLQKRYLEKRVIPSPGKRRCGQLIDRCEGGGNFEIHIHAHHVRNTRSKRPECRRRHTPRNSAAAEIRKQ